MSILAFLPIYKLVKLDDLEVVKSGLQHKPSESKEDLSQFLFGKIIGDYARLLLLWGWLPLHIFSPMDGVHGLKV